MNINTQLGDNQMKVEATRLYGIPQRAHTVLKYNEANLPTYICDTGWTLNLADASILNFASARILAEKHKGQVVAITLIASETRRIKI